MMACREQAETPRESRNSHGAFFRLTANRSAAATPATSIPDPAATPATATATASTTHKVHLLSLGYVPYVIAATVYCIRLGSLRFFGGRRGNPSARPVMKSYQITTLSNILIWGVVQCTVR